MNRSLSQPDAPEGAATRERAWQRLDPRRHFAAALGWPVFALVVAGALLAAELAASEAERHVVADTYRNFGDGSIDGRTNMDFHLHSFDD